MNQCDGCRAGFPRRLSLGGYYYVHTDPLNMGRVVMMCQEYKYNNKKEEKDALSSVQQEPVRSRSKS